MKKEVNKFLIIFVLIFLIGFVSAAECNIISRSSCNDYIIMGLSDSTNAHGEFPDAETYDYVLCCDFGEGDTECSQSSHPVYDGIPKNKILGLSAPTNAHAEAPMDSQDANYENPVCYDGLTCERKTSCDSNYPIEIISLSAPTNAHLGDDYNVKICCKKDECEEMICGGASICNNYEYENECWCDPCNVAESSDLCEEGDICICEWKEGECNLNIEEIERDICGDGELDPSESCDGTNFGSITGCDNSGGTGLDDYTGGTLSCKSDCTFDVSQCTGSTPSCGDDVVNQISESCDGEDLQGLTCGYFGYGGGTLSCDLGCEFSISSCSDEEGVLIGKCSYDENTDDDCEDKFLTYSWTASWEWASENIGQSPPCEEDYILDGGLCYYDPNGAKAKCVDGSNTVPCPAQIQLPFFGNYSVVMIVALIVLIYVFLKFKEKEK